MFFLYFVSFTLLAVFVDVLELTVMRALIRAGGLLGEISKKIDIFLLEGRDDGVVKREAGPEESVDFWNSLESFEEFVGVGPALVDVL